MHFKLAQFGGAQLGRPAVGGVPITHNQFNQATIRNAPGLNP